MVTENFGIILALLLIVVPSIGAMAMGSMGSGTSLRPALARGRDHDDEDEDTRGHPVRNYGRNPDRR